MIAEDMADAHTRQLEARVIELEQRLERTERLQGLTTNYTSAIGNVVQADRGVREASENSLVKHYNDHLHRFHGAPKSGSD